MPIGALLFFMMACMEGWGGEPETYSGILVVNRTGYTLVKLYIAPTSRPAWGRNLLENGGRRGSDLVQKGSESVSQSLVAITPGPVSVREGSVSLLQDSESMQIVPGPSTDGNRLFAEERFFDILGVDTDGDRYLQSGVDLARESVIVLTFKDFLEPRLEGSGWEEYFEEYGNEVTANSGQK